MGLQDSGYLSQIALRCKWTRFSLVILHPTKAFKIDYFLGTSQDWLAVRGCVESIEIFVPIFQP